MYSLVILKEQNMWLIRYELDKFLLMAEEVEDHQHLLVDLRLLEMGASMACSDSMNALKQRLLLEVNQEDLAAFQQSYQT